MPNSNRILDNPASGHSVRFLQTADETGGGLLRIEYVVAKPEPPLHYIPMHFHHFSSERFEVTTGRLGVIMGSKDNRIELEAGQEVLIPPDVVHAFWNAGDGELRFITEIRPAGNFQHYWETVFGLAAQGKVNAKGIPGILQIAALSRSVDVYAPGLPVSVQDALIGGLLGGIGRLLGYG